MTVLAKAKRAPLLTAGRIPGGRVLLPLALLLALAFAGLALEVGFRDRALPRVSVAGVDVGGTEPAELRARLEREAARPWAMAEVRLNGPDGRQWTTTNGALGIAPDVDRAVGEALAYGHRGPLLQRVSEWALALSGEARVPFAMGQSGGALDGWVRSVASEVDRPAVDGRIEATYQGIAVGQPVVGREIDQDTLRAALLAPATLRERTLEVPVRERWPAVDASGIREAAAAARAATIPLEVRADDGTVAEDAPALATLLVIERVPADPSTLDPLPAGALAPATRFGYRVRVDEAKVAAWVSAVGARLDHPAKNASYAVQADGSLAVVPAADGVKIDRAKLTSEVIGRLLTPSATPRVFVPTFVADAPIFTTEQARALAGRMTLVGTFTTTYPPSASRHANITTGAAQFNGLVLAPGETFSFWDRLGPVTVERGYAYAGAIINNRSDENVIGGGLCQVSTTLFNAVARAGYEILERHEHGYYIDRYPLGFDAAVFEPGVDFRWRNDTPYPVLIQSYGYAAAVRFDLISIPTGRRVVLGAPVETNLTSPAPDQPADPAYPPGAVVQGRDVSRTWTVYAGDQVIHQQTFLSHYVPVWGGPAR